MPRYVLEVSAYTPTSGGLQKWFDDLQVAKNEAFWFAQRVVESGHQIYVEITDTTTDEMELEIFTTGVRHPHPERQAQREAAFLAGKRLVTPSKEGG